MSNNSVVVNVSIARSALRLSYKELATSHALEDVNLSLIEVSVPANTTLHEVKFGDVTTAKLVVLNFLTPVSVHLQTTDAPAVKCGMQLVLVDTDVTAIYVDNPTTTVVSGEVWLAS